MLCDLNDVLTTAVLKTRVSRAPNLTAENQALHQLSRGLLRQPLEQLQDLLDAALNLCSAGSAGISLLEDAPGESIFRWVALAGRYRAFVGGTTPRFASPCGVTLDRASPQLFQQPARFFTCLKRADPPIVEGLVVPIAGSTSPGPGTIWIVSHTPHTEFDVEDVRVMTSLAGFAAFACQQLVEQKSNNPTR